MNTASEEEARLTELKVLEHSTLKAQYETLNKKYRNAQKSIDRELTQMSGTFNEMSQTLAQKQAEGVRLTKAETIQMLDTMVEKLKAFKRKSSDVVDEEIEVATACKKRAEYLMAYPSSMSAEEREIWKKKRLDRMLVDHFLRQGYYKTATELADSSDIREFTNLDIFLQSKRIEESLALREIGPCLLWCHENRSKLRKAKSTLEFDLHQQEFVELVKSERLVEAVTHARKHFGTADPSHQDSIKKAMGLLAFNKHSKAGSWEELTNPERWQDLVKQFRKESFTLHQLSDHSTFSVALQCGMSALKTPHCFKDCSKNPNCPVCSPKLNELAKDLPFSHTSNSKLLCAISGDIINENNLPLMLPNGHVYGTQALTFMAATNGGQVICPKTQQEFALSEAQKVYIM